MFQYDVVFEFKLSAFVVNIPLMFLDARFSSLKFDAVKVRSGQNFTPQKVGTFISKKDLKGHLVDLMASRCDEEKFIY